MGMNLHRRRLGNTGLEVGEIGFGAWQLGDRRDWEAMDEDTAATLVEAALAGGVDLFDTAPNYGDGRSEEILGEVLQGRHDKVVLVSKFGHTPAGPKDFSVSWLRPSVEASLARLRTDRLDVLLLHNPPTALYAGTDPLWEALEGLRAEGLIRHYGASLDTAEEIESCLANTGSEVLEVLFNVLHQDARRAFAAVRARDAGILVKIPLDSGWLSGRYRAGSRFTGVRARWSPEEIARRAELVAQVDGLTDDGTPLARRALAFVLSYPEVGCVLPGMRTPSQLRGNLAAAGASLAPAVRRRLEIFWDDLTRDGRERLPW
jgi:aryl-alcohol dehydrogenase-like predicted oxidoreductase